MCNILNHEQVNKSSGKLLINSIAVTQTDLKAANSEKISINETNLVSIKYSTFNLKSFTGRLEHIIWEHKEPKK